jgi:putative phage-type endonuclease
MNSIVDILLNKKQYTQRSDDWYKVRHDIITASNVGSILDANPYLSKYDLLTQKCKDFEEVNNTPTHATAWGIKYEDTAIEIYENLVNEKVYPVGLFIHDQYPWLGASPDGLRDSGKLVEIKCVWRRKINDNVPLYYWMQVQIQLEVCDLEECDLFQCKFTEYKNKTEYNRDKTAFKKGIINYENKTYYWKLEKYSNITIMRDREWFGKVAQLLKNFWDDTMRYRQIGYNRLRPATYNSVNKKRRASELESSTSLKRQRYIKEDWTKWVNASDTKNYIMRDPILDWLNIYGQDIKVQDKYNNFNDYINSRENRFRNAVIENIYQRFKDDDIVSIANMSEKFSIDKYHETIDAMMKGVPFILNGILHNHVNQTYGMPDIILRTDYLEKLIDDVEDVHITNKSHLGHHYCLINIKYMSMTLRNGHIVNMGNMASYKSELIICNEALKSIMGYVPNHMYIIGRKYKDNEYHGPFEKIGMIDTGSYDYEIMVKAHEAVTWVKELKKYGGEWDIYKPHRWELYPNMSNAFDYPWNSVKRNIADKIGEITLLWNCGIRERELAHQNGIYSWKKLNSDIIGFKNHKKNILDNILLINQGNGKDYMVKNKCKKIKRNKLEFFVDFETVSNLDNTFDDVKNYRKNKKTNVNINGMIYMIGLGWIDNGRWKFRSFTVDRLNSKCEKKILKEWLKCMVDIKKEFNFRGNVKIYHWSNAEVIESNKAFQRHNMKNIKLNWVDLCDYFKKNCIAIKGAFSYGLKPIASALYKQKKIKTKWSDTSLDGTSAMLAAWSCERQSLESNKKLVEYGDVKEIIKYNEVDCKVIWEILNLLV